MKWSLKALTTDKLVLFANNGKFFTLEPGQLPGGRGHGEPLRLMVELEESADFIAFFAHDPARKLVVASAAGNGFVVPEAEVIASTRKGKQILNLSDGDVAKVCVPFDGDMIASVGENRKLLVFKAEELNEMTRGKGVILQRFADGSLSDVRAFYKKDGLTWLDTANRTFTLGWPELRDWSGVRAQAGKIVPKGFPRSTTFGPAFG